MKEEDYNNEEFYEEDVLEDLEYLQAPTLKDLEKKVRKRIEDDYGTIEQNPFWDPQTNQWTQVVLYYGDGTFGEEEK